MPGFFRYVGRGADKVAGFVLGERLVPNQATPSDKKNFFQNYADHISHLENTAAEIVIRAFKPNDNGARDPNQLLNVMISEGLARLNMFDALRDGHDYFDEIAGVSAVPILGAVVALGLTVAGIWEGVQNLSSSAGYNQDDEKNHGNIAIGCLLLAATALVLAVTSLIKSAISLVSRPLVTALQGYKPQNIDRFYDTEVAERNKAVVGAFDNMVSAIFQ